MEETSASSDVLRQEIREQSQLEADAILQQAEREAERILNAARAEAETIRRDMMRQADVKAESVRKRILSGVHLEVRRQRLDGREAVIRQVFDGVLGKLETLRQSKAYLPFLKRMVIEGVTALDADAVRILPGDVEKKSLTKKILSDIKADIQQQTGRTVSLSVADHALPNSGVVVVSADERMLFDNRFSVRIDRLRHAMRLYIVRNVFGSEETEDASVRQSS